jgi:hypothetical protein
MPRYLIDPLLLIALLAGFNSGLQMQTATVQVWVETVSNATYELGQPNRYSALPAIN